MIYAYGCGGVHIDHTQKPTSVAATAVCVVADTMDEADAAAESIANGDVACGWAFDAGMREAEADAFAKHLMRIEHASFHCGTTGELHDLIDAISTVLSGGSADGFVFESEADAAVAAERERLKGWGGVLILSRIEDANVSSAAPRGGQTVGPSSNPWTRVPVSARHEIARDMRDLFEHIESGEPAPREG